ncbi:AAA family ATPase [Gluconobacter morbifer]|uniref:MoxR-like protein n=1 Tax=Gluconobacter morbifer G707 TaxID=1088869 RepID=G6XLH2_9PROT|nr:MoxR family ATPase [Gluconobacter morbifer]EHH67226.1 moxR-like protein [Gluconobacter morbifer G707]
MSEQQFSSGVSAGTLQGEADVAEADRLAPVLRQVRQATGGIVLGQDSVIEQILVTILAGGHALLIGAPGLGKTLLVNTVSHVLGLDATRIQFTPDLMPSDITGAEILDQDANGHRAFRFLPGPIFGQLVLADEINRASPRTQSALLQAMAEHRVTQGGKDYALPRPFHVLATQNPIEQEGTYPLPEAQLDRFMLGINLHFPDRQAERQMLLQTTGATTAQAPVLMDAASLLSAQALVRRLPVGDQIVDAILTLTRSLRPDDPTAPAEVREAIAYGPGPRAAQALMIATRARALLDGRLVPSLDDIAALAEPVLAHRIGLGFGARASGTDSTTLTRRQVQTIL